jgi:hypothetical protein
VDTPVEILVSNEFEIGEVADTAPSRMATIVPAPLSLDLPEAPAAEPTQTAAIDPAPVRNAPVLQRDVPIMADPLVNPAAPPTRQRQRIAAPSNW